MFQDRLTGQVQLAIPRRKHPRGRPRSSWRDYIAGFAWFRRGVEPAELSEIGEKCEVLRATAPAALPRGKAGIRMNEWPTRLKLKP